MPRYFFDVHDDIHLIDEVGQELPDLVAAKDEATRALAEMAKDLLPGNGSEKDLLVVVRDEADVVLQVSLRYGVIPPL